MVAVERQATVALPANAPGTLDPQPTTNRPEPESRGTPVSGERYLANTYDLDNEKIQCQIDEIIVTGNERPYTSKSSAFLNRDGAHVTCRVVGS